MIRKCNYCGFEDDVNGDGFIKYDRQGKYVSECTQCGGMDTETMFKMDKFGFTSEDEIMLWGMGVKNKYEVDELIEEFEYDEYFNFTKEDIIKTLKERKAGEKFTDAVKKAIADGMGVLGILQTILDVYSGQYTITNKVDERK